MPNIYSTEKFEKEFTYSGSDLGATYTPENYNVPEGSYSTDPYNGAVRVAEMKQMVKTLHNDPDQCDHGRGLQSCIQRIGFLCKSDRTGLFFPGKRGWNILQRLRLWK